MARIKDAAIPLWRIFKKESNGNANKCCHLCRRGFDASSYVIEYSLRRSQDWYHVKCCMNSKYIKPCCTEQLRGFDKLPKKNQNIIAALLWPKQVNKSQRAQLRLIKCIDEMSDNELRIELKKRDIQIRIFRIYSSSPNTPEERLEERRKRLMKYVGSAKCKEMYNMIVKGYCKKLQKENHDIVIPVYLQDMIYKYYPPYLLKIN